MSSSSPQKILEYLSGNFLDIDQSIERLIEETVYLTEIKAPPFNEDERAQAVQKIFNEQGYKTQIDSVGNVIAGKNLSSPCAIILSAHLDTVFPKEVEIKVKREGVILRGPGVGDDTRGLVSLLEIARQMKNLNTEIPILYLATVGEEGMGDLRGVKNFFFGDEHHKRRPIDCFISIDGMGVQRVVNTAVGSKRYRISISGPGGHSYGSYGTVNPIYAISDLIKNISLFKNWVESGSTFSVGKISGGTSVNAIPEKAFAEFDFRSKKQETLDLFDQRIRDLASNSIKIEEMGKKGKLNLNIEIVGDRPTGTAAEDHPLISVFMKANEIFKLTVIEEASSTDSNIPISLGIPAITVAGVDKAGGAHSLEEWIDAGKSSLVPIKRNLLLVAILSKLKIE